jgi:transposase
MAMGRRKPELQGQMFIAVSDLPAAAGHPFYEKLNQALRAMDFDRRVEEACRKFYQEEVGRPSIPPGVYFRLLLIGYFEGIDSERGIAWRVADSLSLRGFLGYELQARTPDHSSLSRIRWRLDPQTHDQIFRMVLLALREAGLIKGQTIGVDATTLEANAALRSIVRRDTGQSYQDYLEQLAKNAGIEQPTRSDLAKLDRHRKDKGSNKQWEHPHDPDARIAKMKYGSTHLAHKAEHVVDLETGALLGVSLHEADQGDTQTVVPSVEAAFDHLAEAIETMAKPSGTTVEQTGAATVAVTVETATEATADEAGAKPAGAATVETTTATPAAAAGQPLPEKLFAEIVTDKGYHSNQSCQDLQELGMRTYLSEPERGRRHWAGQAEAQHAVYANRRRVRGDRGQRLQRRRGEYLERSNAHMYETGGMRRTHLRGHENILKRLIVHAAGFNLGLLLRSLIGIGKPRRLQDFPGLLLTLILWLCGLFQGLSRLRRHLPAYRNLHARLPTGKSDRVMAPPKTGGCSTGC